MGVELERVVHDSTVVESEYLEALRRFSFLTYNRVILMALHTGVSYFIFINKPLIYYLTKQILILFTNKVVFVLSHIDYSVINKRKMTTS